MPTPAAPKTPPPAPAKKDAPPAKKPAKDAPAPEIPELDPRLQELLDRIMELSDEELRELRDLILTQIQARPDAPVDELEVLASAAAQVTQESRNRDEREPGRAARRTLDAFARTARQDRDAAHPAAVPADRRPRFTTAGVARAVTASGNELHDNGGVAREFVNALSRLNTRDPRHDGQRQTVVTLHADRPDDQQLRVRDGAEAVTAAMAAAAAEHQQQALTAAGGLGAPGMPDYMLPGFEVADRPVKAALPTFTAERGGIRFMRPPSLADLAGSVGIWDVAKDILAATDVNTRKPALRVSPTNEVVVDTQAVTSVLIFGNMLSRAYPEWVERCVGLALAAHARIAEQQLLTQIGSLSTAVTGTTVPVEGGNLGATRVLLPLLDRAATGLRDRLRAGAQAPLQLILPHWSRALLRTDLAIQEPGDATVGVTDAELDAYLASRNLVPAWALDGEAGYQFSAQNPGAVNTWPTSIRCYMFPAGSMQFLDAGVLDLGLVRDSVLNLANDYMLFSETFEAVAFRGGQSLRITQAVSPSGIARAAAS